MRKIISRPDPDNVPDLPLPFHVRSTGYHEAPFGWFEKVPGARKNFVQIFWCMGGRGEILLPDRSFTVSRGEIFHHPPGEEHFHKSVDRQEPWRYYWVTFDGPDAAAFFSCYRYPNSGFYAGECPTQYFLEIETLLRERSPYSQRRAVAVVAEILALAGGTLQESGENDLVKGFIRLAHKGFADPETKVGQIAARLGVHRTTLNRAFHRAMSLYPGDYLAELRIQHALSLLRETSLPIKEIAYECGIANTSYFCRLIRKHTGKSPLSYRHHTPMD